MLTASRLSLSEADRKAASLAQRAALGSPRPGDCAELARWLCPPGQEALQAAVLRDLFGNPFRKVRRVGSQLHARVASLNNDRPCEDILFVREWLSWHRGTVHSLAQAIHEEGDWDRAPILGDALEEAGCADAVILDHCRGAGSHTRGCWVIDLILDRS
jgi:hypothetical protein